MRGYTSVALLGTSLGWEGRRAQITLDGLVTEGLAWVDDGDTAMGRLFWMPSLSGAMQDAALSET